MNLAETAPPVKVKVPREPVEAWARELVRELAPACERVKIAGSLRRGRPLVGDVEIVAQPKPAASLFDGDAGPTLGDVIERLVRGGFLAWDQSNRKNGPSYKRLTATALDGLGVDLFLTERDKWGSIFTIRTGDFEFSSALMTQRYKNGLMPDDLRQEGGGLWRGAEQIPVPTEADFFAALGLPVVPPSERNIQTVWALRRKVNPS